MSALTADTVVTLKAPGYPVLPAKDGEDIYHHALCCYNADGEVVPAANTAGLRFAGISRRSLTAAADQAVELDKESWYLATGSGFTASDVGKRVYLSDDQTVALSTSKLICGGRIAQYVSAAQVWVDPRDSAGDLALNSVGLGTLAAGLSDAQLATLKLPVGRTAVLREVQVGCTTVTGTCTVDVKVGGTSLLTAVVTPSAAAVVRGTIDTAALDADDLLTVHATTQASTGAVTGLTVTLVWEVY